MQNTGLNASYAYNVDGLRMAKTVNGVEHKYIWQGGRLVSEAYGGRELEFFYDEGGNPCALRYRSGAGAEPVVYYYVTNLQGDVLSLVDGEGFSAAEYYYNAWGLPMGSTGAMADINPLRYRGYYYDTELGMYYLKSRYYDPFVCRFINADVFASTGQGFIGTNMFAYCNNNPVMYVDSQGNFPISVAAIVTGIIVGGLVGAVYGAINARAAAEDVGIGALSGAATGALTGAVAGAVAIAGPLVKAGAVLFNAVLGAGGDYISQRQQYDNKAANGTASGEFKVDVGSMVIAGASAAVGTGLNIGLTTAGTVTETIVTGITGGYFGSLAAGAVEMMGRGMYILSGQQSFKGAVKAKKPSDFRSQHVFVKCRA